MKEHRQIRATILALCLYHYLSYSLPLILSSDEILTEHWSGGFTVDLFVIKMILVKLSELKNLNYSSQLAFIKMGLIASFRRLYTF